jgi:SAM-dependent methyltransferase
MADHEMVEKFELINNIKCYAPQLAELNSDYPKEVFKLLYEAENTNFWFISRNKIIQNLFKKHVGSDSKKVLEIGCGTGYVMHGLYSAFPNYNLVGSEIYLEGIKFAQIRLPNAEFIQLDATDMPFSDEYDAIGAFDVLEHIVEDELVMKNIYKSLKKDGLFMISVPQYQWMWSINDDIAYHKRRYTRSELESKLEATGFEIKYISSFVFALFPFMVLSRILKKKKVEKITDDIILQEMNELTLDGFLNFAFKKIMKIDEFLISLNISLPFGGSLIAVATKK